jgi:hypothetical protein
MRRVLFAVLLTLAAAPACGPASSSSTSTPPSSSGPNVLAAAAGATRAAGSALMTMDMTIPSAGGTVQAHATGVFRTGSPARGQMHMNMHVAGQAVVMDERIIGAVIYMRSAAFARALPGGKSWMKIDLSQMGSAGTAMSSMMNTSQNDPTQSLTYLQAASKSIQKLGTEDVDGVATTHYHSLVDFRKAVDLIVQRVPASQRPAVRRLYEQVESQSGITNYPTDVWLDAQGRVRKMHLAMPIPPTGQTMDMTITMSHFGVPVHIAAPPARQVADLSGMMPQQ